MRTNENRRQELNTSSVADIAFLLLSFFLMTTVISDEKGLTLTLPEWRDTPIDHPVHERNLFKIQINSFDELMIEGERVTDFSGLRERIIVFVMNNGMDPDLSDSPEQAIVSLRTDRGTTQKAFIDGLDEIQAAYYEIYANRVSLSVEDYRKLDFTNPKEKLIIERAKQGIPMNISLAEPTTVLSNL